MNDRNKLKQLAEQAGFLTYAGPDIHVPEDPYGGGCTAELAKFAELIIRECAEVANNNYDKGFCPVGGFIEDHFELRSNPPG